MVGTESIAFYFDNNGFRHTVATAFPAEGGIELISHSRVECIL